MPSYERRDCFLLRTAYEVVRVLLVDIVVKVIEVAVPLVTHLIELLVEALLYE